MRISHRWAGLRMSVAALGIVGGGAAAHASGINSSASIMSHIEYNTSGTIDSTGVSGAPVIGFNSVADASFTAPSSFSLGEFLTSSALPAGSSTTYTNTPFHITLGITQVDGGVPMPNGTPVTISGVLNGTVTGTSQSNVVATFNPITNATFQTGQYTDNLSVLDSTASLVPSTTNGGLTTAQGQIIVTAFSPPPVPEPASIAIFVMAAAGLGLYRHRNRAGR